MVESSEKKKKKKDYSADHLDIFYDIINMIHMIDYLADHIVID